MFSRIWQHASSLHPHQSGSVQSNPFLKCHYIPY
jgi:hypothetical protein